LEITVEVEVNDELKIDIEVGLGTAYDAYKHDELVQGAVEAAHNAIKNEIDRLRVT
jgi:GTP cyclohydrolase III